MFLRRAPRGRVNAPHAPPSTSSWAGEVAGAVRRQFYLGGLRQKAGSLVIMALRRTRKHASSERAPELTSSTEAVSALVYPRDRSMRRRRARGAAAARRETGAIFDLSTVNSLKRLSYRKRTADSEFRTVLLRKILLA